MTRCCAPGQQAQKTSALELGKVLAHAVDLADVRPAGKQGAGHGLLVLKGQGHFASVVRVAHGRGQQRGAPAGDEVQHQRVFIGLARQLGHAPRRLHPGLVRHRVRGLHLADARKLLRVAVLGAHQTAPLQALRQPGEDALQGQGHARAGLAAAQHQHAGIARKLLLVPGPVQLHHQPPALQPHALGDHSVGVDALQRRLENGAEGRKLRFVAHGGSCVAKGWRCQGAGYAFCPPGTSLRSAWPKPGSKSSVGTAA
jgi:hypothetical protein